MKKIIIFISFICITTASKGQINEIGFFVGGSNYIGDIGSEYFINPNNIMGGLIYKWNINPRMSFRGSFTYARISANDAKSTNTGRQMRGLKFSNTITEIAVGMEYNYFEFNIDDVRKRRTPYLLFEIAAFGYSTATQETAPLEYDYTTKIGLSIPFGIGYKTKLINDFAFAIEVGARYTFTDEIDYNNPDINSLTFGNPNNNDWYMFTSISFLYTFGRPPCFATPY